MTSSDLTPCPARHRAGRSAFKMAALLLLLSLFFPQAHADTPVQVGGKSSPLTTHFSWQMDNGAVRNGETPDFERLMSDADSAWQSGRLPHGYNTQAVWLRVTLQHPGASTSRKYLVFDSPLLDRADLYLFRGKQLIDQQQHRLTTAVAYRPIEHRLIILPVQLPPESETTLYLRVFSDTSLQLGATLWDPEAFLIHDQHWLTLHVFLLGMMTVMALYNLAIYMITRIKAYLLYVSYVLSIATFQACMVGIANQYLFGVSSLMLGNGNFTIACLTFLTATAFIDELMKLKITAPIFHRIAQFLMLAWGLLFFASFIYAEAEIGVLVIALALFSPIVGLWIGIHLWHKGYEIAPLFTIAWTVLLVGTLVFVLMINGMIERNLFTIHIQEVGAALEVVLLAITLAKRLQLERQKRYRAQEHAILMAQQVNNARKEKLDAQAGALDAERKAREAQEELVKTQLQANIELERMVDQRTLELKNALERVKDMNEQLETLSITDALTGAYNRRYFDEQLAVQRAFCAEQNKPLGLALVDIDYFKKVNDEHGHLVGDQCLKLVASLLQKNTRADVDIVARYGGEEFAIISPDADANRCWEICERVRLAIAETPYKYRDKVLNLTTSIGIAELSLAAPQPLQQMIQEADSALYQAKSEGRNRTKFSTSAHQAQS